MKQVKLNQCINNFESQNTKLNFLRQKKKCFTYSFHLFFFVVMVRAGDRMNDDCLQIILEACDGCPFTLHAASQVSRQWRSVSQRPSVVKQNDYATFS